MKQRQSCCTYKLDSALSASCCITNTVQFPSLATAGRKKETDRLTVSNKKLLCGSGTQSCLTLRHPWTPLSFTISWSLLEFSSCESVMPSNHLIRCFSLLLLPSIFPNIRVFPKKLPGNYKRTNEPFLM